MSDYHTVYPLLSVFLCLLLLGCTAEEAAFDYTNWEVYGGDKGSHQYSALDEINTRNVAKLTVAWTYSTGDKSEGNTSQIQANPIVVDGVLYASSPRLKVFALNAATGEEQWIFDPFAEPDATEASGVNRGVVYWESEDGTEKRILFAAGPFLYALDAQTGTRLATFGEAGRVDLRHGLGREADSLFVSSTTPGAVYQDVLVLGTRVSEGPVAAPGHVRAYDVRTGAIRWIFHTIPQPGEFGYETWPEDAWQHIGGANVWSGITIDEQRGMAFLPTGSASFDFWGGNRKGENLFANSILALDAVTGERIWHYQVVRHDLWDRDLPAAPNLVTVTHDGARIDAVAQITKSGHVFLLNRDTGEPLFPVEEVAAPPSDLYGEEAWLTQPLPVKPPPFARQSLTEDQLTDRSPEAHAHVKAIWQTKRSGGPFVPPSTQGTIIFPGFDGGGEWGGAAFDPTSGLLYVNSNEMPWILTMVPVTVPEAARPASLGAQVYAVNCAMCHRDDRSGNLGANYPSLLGLDAFLRPEEVMQLLETGRGYMPSYGHLTASEKEALIAFLFDQEEPVLANVNPTDVRIEEPTYGRVPYSHTGYNRFLDQEGYPAIKPPWGTLNAIDLNTGTLAWQVPLGSVPELVEQGLPPTGTENYGGPVVTAGGLIFIGATKDEKFRAFDKRDGTLLWEADLPAGGYATPATYAMNGKQFVVMAAGGGKMGTPSGDTYVAFALPK